MEEAWTALEADFQRFYGLDLADVCWGSPPMPIRRLAALIIELPDDARFPGRQIGGWTVERELSAATVDLLSAIEHTLLIAHSDPKKRSKRPPPPKPVPRPDEVTKAAAAARRATRKPPIRERLRAFTDTLNRSR